MNVVEAREESTQIQEFLRQFEAMAQQAPAARERFAFLSGFIAATETPDEPVEG
jgi:hypothetical protein